MPRSQFFTRRRRARQESQTSSPEPTTPQAEAPSAEAAVISNVYPEPSAPNLGTTEVLTGFYTSLPITIPQDCICPLTREVMRDPVMVADGFTYEREMITQWFESSESSRSPMTNLPLPHTNLLPNRALKNTIQSLLAQLSTTDQQQITSRQELLNLQELVAARETQLSEEQRAKESLQHQLTDIQGELARAREQIQSHTEQLDLQSQERQQIAGELRQEQTQGQTDIQELNQRLQESQRTSERLQQERSTIEERVQELGGQFSEAQQTLEQLQQERSTMEEQVQTLETQVRDTQLAGEEEAQRLQAEHLTGRIRHYTNKMEQDPNNANLYWKRGEAYRTLKKYPAALQDLNETIRLAESDGECEECVKSMYLTTRGMIYYDQGNHARAIEDFTAAIREERCADSLGYRGAAYLQLGQLDDAQRDIDQSLAINPHDEFVLHQKQLLEDATQTQEQRSIPRSRR
jgi:tetratricopeptide (TPR) repeat protein